MAGQSDRDVMGGDLGRPRNLGQSINSDKGDN